MSINQRYGINPEKTAKKGKLFHTIDYELNSNYSVSDFKNKSTVIPAASFFIDGKEFKLTLHEIERMFESSEAVIKTLYTKYRIGILGK